METVCTLFELKVFKFGREWHVSCGFPLKIFRTKREAVSWCKRTTKMFRDGRDAVNTKEYALCCELKQLLMRCE